MVQRWPVSRYTPLPPYLPTRGGVAEKVGAGFRQGVYKITPILQTSPLQHSYL
nr:MAG TPA: hypothetical protein [Caudoviricetes sp.]